MSEPKIFISLGAGVQSSCVSLMSACGELPIPTCGIFADTQDEPRKVYEWLKYLEAQLPFPVWHVTNGSVMADGLPIHTSKKSGKRYIKSIIPAFVLNPDGTKGLLGRKCTADYKVKVIIAKIRSIIGNVAILEWRKKHRTASNALSQYEKETKSIKAKNKTLPRGQKLPLPMRPEWAWSECQQDSLAVSWIGISKDEAHRMKESKVPWIRNEWPLIDKGMSREDCQSWMSSRGHPEAPRSACKKCPFHSDDEWIRMRDEEPDEFEEACDYEEQLQNAAKNQEALLGLPFLHEKCQPLRTIKFAPTAKGYRQVSLFGNECEGLCGV